MFVLLAIDDEATILHAFRAIFRDPDVNLLTATSAQEGLRIAAKQLPDVVLLDLTLPDMSGLEVFRRIRQLDARMPVIFITGSGTTETAIEAMKLGAYEYLLKDNILQPSETQRWRDLVRRAFEIRRMMLVPAVMADTELPQGPADVLVGKCPAMQEVYKAVGRVAARDVTVLVLGESGTGKELVARAIYQHSRRVDGPFLAINCAAIPETLLESELFGHEKGAFTGADRKRIGKFEQCSGGTLFLDEIGDMSPLTQTKLLRVLQEQTFERVGGNETIHTDVRLIAATNRDLEKLVESGQFRSDLYYRLSVFTIHIPPLRERLEDLPLLVDHLFKRFARELDKPVRQVAPETLAILRRHPWPGNIRELQSVLKQALLQTTGSVLLPDFLPPYVFGSHQGVARPAMHDSTAFPDLRPFLQERLNQSTQSLYEETLLEMERQLLTEVLRHTGGNQAQASRILGITRNSLRFKIRSLNINIGHTIRTSEDVEEGETS
ncbi:MAG: sigma-54-dependent transcriptional regulator [Gemmataceae bacterium]